MQPYGMNTRSGIGSWRDAENRRHGSREHRPAPSRFQKARRSLVFRLICGAALRTVTTDFKPGDHNVEAAISLNLAL